MLSKCLKKILGLCASFLDLQLSTIFLMWDVMSFIIYANDVGFLVIVGTAG